MADKKTIKQSEEILGITFQNKSLIATALTHSSFAKRSTKIKIEDNERLEFFGDAVLKLVVSEYLYKRFPDYKEGVLTTIRSQIISDKYLAQMAKSLGIGPLIQFSYGEQNTGGSEKASNLANTFEAILGALYLDQGLESVQNFLIPLMEKELTTLLTTKSSKDKKTSLQEWLQHNKCELPTYEVIREEGPDHDKKFFIEASILLNTKRISEIGIGKNKKEAEQEAAKLLLEKLTTLP
jgi:ribonuclease-3